MATAVTALVFDASARNNHLDADPRLIAPINNHVAPVIIPGPILREVRLWTRPVAARVAFLRVSSITAIDGPAAEPPYQLGVGRTYRVEVFSYNPHLDQSVLDALHLLPFPDTLRVEIAADEVPIPADGSVELMIEPLDVGASSLEFSVTRRSDFWFALRLDWQAKRVAPVVVDAPVEPTAKAIEK